MYKLKLRTAFESAHTLSNPYTKKCKNIHGHNWKVDFEIWQEKLSNREMVIDFKELKDMVKKLDHTLLNDIIEEPTAENIAKYLYDEVNKLDKFNKVIITVHENDNSSIAYENQ